jgi:glycosyltransferase involved in cell wall biosynthesis
MESAGIKSTVTVVIPCFNQARYLADAVKSVHIQTHPSIECIVVDDGSTDETSEVAARLGARVIRQQNRGVSAARNAGLRVARGELVVFLDADDVLLPDALARGAEALAVKTGIDAVVSRCEAMDERGTPIPVSHHDVDPNHLYLEWLSRNFVWTPGAAMFRRHALIELGGFCTDYGPAADLALYLRLARDERIAYIPGYSVRYRQHAESMSRNPALMLRATQLALRRESREAPSHAQAAIKRGRRVWRDWYGEQIVHDVRRGWHTRTWTRAHLKAMLVLIWNCPGLVLQHLTRKTARSIRTIVRSPSTVGRMPR